MIILDQEKMTMFNSKKMAGMGIMPDNGRFLFVAIMDMGGANVLLGSYQTMEMAETVRSQLITAFNIGKHVFEMPEDMPVIPLEFVEEENDDDNEPR